MSEGHEYIPGCPCRECAPRFLGYTQEPIRPVQSALRFLPENEAVEALIPCMRQSAQEIVAALSRRGYVIAQRD